MLKRIEFYYYSIKYWLQGETWIDAKAWAHYIIYSFKKVGNDK